MTNQIQVEPAQARHKLALKDDGKSGKPPKPPDDTTIVKTGFEGEDSGSFLLLPDSDLHTVEASTKYEILGEIARGGAGAVFRAKSLVFGRIVALKILLKEHLGNAQVVRRFVNESRIMGYLQHPGIAQVYEMGTCYDGRPFYSMKLVDGVTLADKLNPSDDEVVPLSTLLSIFQSVCQAIAYTHAKGIIHLDLKPGNIMVGTYGEVHVMDWGLAKTLRTEVVESIDLYSDSELYGEVSQLNRETQDPIRGTLPYMSPEMARGERVGKPSDIFGLGAILCEILTGQPPFTGTNKKDIFRQVVKCELGDALSTLEATDTDRTLVRLAKRCLSPIPEERPAGAHLLVAELANYNESALSRMESDMSRFFDLSLDLFCIAGLDGYFRRINSNFTKVLGFPESVLLETPFIDFVHHEDREKTIRQMSVLSDGQPVVRFRNRYLSIDGDYYEFEWTAKSIPQEQIIYAVARNVTEEK